MTKTKETRRKVSKGEPPKAPLPEFLSRKERLAAGKALRDKVPREHHAAWKPPAKRRDPIPSRLNASGLIVEGRSTTHTGWWWAGEADVRDSR